MSETISRALAPSQQNYPTNPIYPGNPPPPYPGSPPGWCRPPTSVWPPCPPPGPWPAGLYRFNECFDQVQQLEAFLSQVIRNMLAEDPSLIAVGQPIVGVTNGTDAQPGMVGEFKQMVANFSWTANANFSSLISPGSLPAGDWDCWWYFGVTAPVFGAQIYLNPVPPGFTGDMDQVLYTTGQATPETFFLNSPHVRALTSVTSQILLQTNISGGPSAGAGSIIFNARRNR